MTGDVNVRVTLRSRIPSTRSMAMVEQLRSSDVRTRSGRERVACLAAMGLLLSLPASSRLAAQDSNVHYRYQGNEPPGAIGSWQLLRGGPLPGYFQPVEIKAPPGVLISLAVDGHFFPRFPRPCASACSSRRFIACVSPDIPLHEGQEVYPTIEVIDRLYPPVGQWPAFRARRDHARRSRTGPRGQLRHARRLSRRPQPCPARLSGRMLQRAELV